MSLRALVALDGCVETRAVEEINGYTFDHISAFRINVRGIELLRAALDAAPATPPRVRRGMVSAWPNLGRRQSTYAREDFAASEDERVPAKWRRTWTGEPMPEVVWLIERSRKGH